MLSRDRHLAKKSLYMKFQASIIHDKLVTDLKNTGKREYQVKYIYYQADQVRLGT
jgi:hypothetical protein